MPAEAFARGDANITVVERIGQFRAAMRGGVLRRRNVLRGTAWRCMASASCGRFALNARTKASKRSWLCRLLKPDGRVASFLQGEGHALKAPVLLQMARLDAFDRNPEPPPPDRQL